MDSIRVTKVSLSLGARPGENSRSLPQVEGVLCTKAGHSAQGTVHLTAHHLIFNYDDNVKEEMWVS